MKLSPQQVKHVAKLAKLDLTPQETETLSDQLTDILSHVEQLDEVDTTNVMPTYQTIDGAHNVLRDDVITPSLSPVAALSQAPRTLDGYFVTRGVFDEA